MKKILLYFLLLLTLSCSFTNKKNNEFSYNSAKFSNFVKTYNENTYILNKIMYFYFFIDELNEIEQIKATKILTNDIKNYNYEKEDFLYKKNQSTIQTLLQKNDVLSYRYNLLVYSSVNKNSIDEYILYKESNEDSYLKKSIISDPKNIFSVSEFIDTNSIYYENLYNKKVNNSEFNKYMLLKSIRNAINSTELIDFEIVYSLKNKEFATNLLSFPDNSISYNLLMSSLLNVDNKDESLKYLKNILFSMNNTEYNFPKEYKKHFVTIYLLNIFYTENKDIYFKELKDIVKTLNLYDNILLNMPKNEEIDDMLYILYNLINSKQKNKKYDDIIKKNKTTINEFNKFYKKYKAKIK